MFLLHFFIGGCDWYITEHDGDDLFWGYAILGDPEMGPSGATYRFENSGN